LNIQLDFQDAPVFRNVPLDKVHKKGYTISVEKQLMVVSEVINKAGTKVLTIRTSKYIENKTDLSIEILVQDDKSRYPHKAILGTVLLTHLHSSSHFHNKNSPALNSIDSLGVFPLSNDFYSTSSIE